MEEGSIFSRLKKMFASFDHGYGAIAEAGENTKELVRYVHMRARSERDEKSVGD